MEMSKKLCMFVYRGISVFSDGSADKKKLICLEANIRPGFKVPLTDLFWQLISLQFDIWMIWKGILVLYFSCMSGRKNFGFK